MATNKIFSMSFSSVYPYYIAKAEKKGRSKEEVDEIIKWLFGYTQTQFIDSLEKEISFEDFIKKAPNLNPARFNITGVICGVRIENIEDPIMKEIRHLDKLIDELSKGKSMEKILRN